LRDGQGRPLLVGSADRDLRREVRSLFSGDHQREAGAALRVVRAIDHVACESPVAAAATAEALRAELLTPTGSRRRRRHEAGAHDRSPAAVAGAA
jgi:hypothetical protein